MRRSEEVQLHLRGGRGGERERHVRQGQRQAAPKTAGGKMGVPVRQRVLWCLLAGMAAMALMLGGGMASLQALTIAVGLPFAIVLPCMCGGHTPRFGKNGAENARKAWMIQAERSRCRKSES